MKYSVEWLCAFGDNSGVRLANNSLYQAVPDAYSKINYQGALVSAQGIFVQLARVEGGDALRCAHSACWQSSGNDAGAN